MSAFSNVGLQQCGLALVVEVLAEQLEFATAGIGVDSQVSLFASGG
jgi:hypothetical protein